MFQLFKSQLSCIHLEPPIIKSTGTGIRADIEIETKGRCRGDITLQAVRWDCIQDDNCGNFSIQCSADSSSTKVFKKTSHFNFKDNIEKNVEWIFSAKEINSLGDSGWGNAKSHIAGYDISQVDENPRLVLVTAGDTSCAVQLKPPCNYVGKIEYEICVHDNMGTQKGNQTKQYTRWAVT